MNRGDMTPDQLYLSQLTVLYVEDEAFTRAMFTEFLERLVGTLLVAENGEQGLAAFHAHKPGIIISDVLMPVMDGLTMAEEIRKVDKQVPIIIMTAFDESSYLLVRFKAMANLLIGDGSGTKADPTLGCKAAEDSSDQLEAHLKGANLVILIACMGGGTGTGSTPVIARIANESGAYVAVVCTIPFNREGERRLQKAVDGIEQLKGKVDLLVVIPNEFILAPAKPALGILEEFKRMDDLVLQVGQEIIQKYAGGAHITQIKAVENIEGASCKIM